MLHGQVDQEGQGFFSGDPFCQVAFMEKDSRGPEKGKVEMSAVFFSGHGASVSLSENSLREGV